MVPDALIPMLKKRVEEVNQAGGEILPELQPGDLVHIRSGPFAGYEAIFDALLPGNERARILLKMLQGQSAKMEISAGQLERRKKRT
jgi:transcription antitermination factor NusG